MPRIVFESFEGTKEWCEEFIEKGKKTHVLYTTDNNELIIEPRRSTRPLRYGYIWSSEVKKFAKELVSLYGLPYFHIERYEWDVEKFPGVQVRVK